ncbi:hypothetical protein [Fictibacillus fluitans]|uniref:Uncharacterized protein n=1 Tax=Fictibacillus fluitans TaxID=3058422 RepID=A0ABT8HWM3_9BACL|nr:hypothetical protein [Fictibacillus sp. NE201]MDN4525159.1 hypothetical protein [Fictibacillus sp. NE201]
MNKILLLIPALLLLVFSAAVLPILGEEADVRGVGMGALLMCTYLLIEQHDKEGGRARKRRKEQD